MQLQVSDGAMAAFDGRTTCAMQGGMPSQDWNGSGDSQCSRGKLAEHLRFPTLLRFDSFLVFGHSEDFYYCQNFSHTYTYTHREKERNTHSYITHAVGTYGLSSWSVNKKLISHSYSD